MTSILIIEDEVSIRNVLKNILLDENKHYNIDEASDGEQGFKLLQKNNQKDKERIMCFYTNV